MSSRRWWWRTVATWPQTLNPTPGPQVVLDDLKEVVAAYNRSMTEAAAFVDERRPGMVVALERSVAETQEGMHGLIVELRSGR